MRTGTARFRDREDAGDQLAALMTHLADPTPLVLGLPRGGVIVASRIAAALEAPLDVLVVRKLGAPRQPELAIGAVADEDEPRTVLNDEIVRLTGADEAYIEQVVARELDEVRRRQAMYRRGRPALPRAGRTVIVVDDGIATGATVRAALIAIRCAGVSRLVLAVPVGPAETIARLREDVDELIAVEAPREFTAVGAYYGRFTQTSDAEVVAALDHSTQHTAG